MPTLSVALIVKNEAHWLEDCLASVRPVADQVVVVDTGSTDGTEAMALQLGAEVHHFPWIDDFSAARNESLRHCTGDWVLVLDADEELAVESLPLLRECLAQTECDAFRIRVANYFDSGLFTSLDMVTRPNTSTHPKAKGHDLVSDFPALRLFRRHPWVHYRGRIHELVDDAFTEHGLPIGKADVFLHHFGKVLQDREDRKRSYYLDLARKDALEHPQEIQAQFNLLIQALTAQAWDVASEAAWAYARLRRDLPTMVLYGGGLAMQHQGRHEEALQWLGSLLRAIPDHVAARTREGVGLAALGRIPEARTSLRLATEAGPTYALAWLNLSELELRVGDAAACREALEGGLAALPRETRLWEALVELGLRENSLERAARDASRALQAVPEGGDGLWHRLVVLALLQQGQGGAARVVLQRGLKAFPEDAELAGLGQRMGLA